MDAKRFAERDLSVLAEMPTVFLDTETTGLNSYFGERGDEIVEICICNDAGQAILNSLVKPARRTQWPDAQAIHGIAPADVQNAPTLADLMPSIKQAIDGKRVVIYNSNFDTQFFPQGTFDPSQVECCMLRYAEVIGEWHDYFNDWRWHTLRAAATHVGHEWSGHAHRALADALAAWSVWRWLQAGGPPVEMPVAFPLVDEYDP